MRSLFYLKIFKKVLKKYLQIIKKVYNNKYKQIKNKLSGYNNIIV